MCRETRCGFKDIEVQKRMLRKELSSIVDDDDKMGYDDFEFALTQLMNFVGVKHNIDLLFAQYSGGAPTVNIEDFVQGILGMNAKQKQDKIRRDNDEFYQNYEWEKCGKQNNNHYLLILLVYTSPSKLNHASESLEERL